MTDNDHTEKDARYLSPDARLRLEDCRAFTGRECDLLDHAEFMDAEESGTPDTTSTPDAPRCTHYPSVCLCDRDREVGQAVAAERARIEGLFKEWFQHNMNSNIYDDFLATIREASDD